MSSTNLYVALAIKFREAGCGTGDGICSTDLDLLNLSPPKRYKTKTTHTVPTDTWEGLCVYVYESLTNQPFPPCKLIGSGFRSQYHGNTVADAIIQKYAPPDYKEQP
jgi:hypothetical protein